MAENLVRVAELMAARLEALQLLADEITAAQQACVALEVESLQAHDKAKERLCAEVSRMDAELAGLAGAAAREGFVSRLGAQGGGAPHQDIQDRIQRLGEQSEAARVEVVRRNGAYAEFLRRARSNVKVMTNVISHCLGVYPPWALPASAGSPWERGY
jgi:hypothetical protein